MAVTGTVTSTDGTVTVQVLLDQNDDGTWVLDISPTIASGDTMEISVNGEQITQIENNPPVT